MLLFQFFSAFLFELATALQKGEILTVVVLQCALASNRDCCRLVTADRKAQAVQRAIANVQSLELWLLVALLPVFHLSSCF